MRPVSRNTYPSASASLRPSVDFPEAAGPSMAMGSGGSDTGGIVGHRGLPATLLRGLRSRVQPLHLLIRQFAEGAAAERSQVEGPEPNPPEEQDLAPERFHHAADLPVPALPERQQQPRGSLRSLLTELTFRRRGGPRRSEEHTSELQSQSNLVCRLLLEKKKTNNK